MTIRDIRSAEDVPTLLNNVTNGKLGVKVAGVWKHRKKDGSIIDVEIISHHLELESSRVGKSLRRSGCPRRSQSNGRDNSIG